MQFYSKRTVDEQASRLPPAFRDAYKKSQIDRITIFDGNTELEITGYCEYSYLDEKSYKTQPVRTMDGVIADIEEYATVLVPRLIIKYNMMGIEDYRALMKMFKARNGYIIKCYDVVEDNIVRNEMYVATPSMPKIYQKYLSALGIQEYLIELIGTLASINPQDSSAAKTEEIKFYDGRTPGGHIANLGQTWRDWVNSSYNTVYADIDSTYNTVSFFTDASPLTVYLDGKKVNPDDYIFIDRTYSLV